MAASLVLFSLLLLHFTQAEELMSIDGAPSPSPQAQPIDCGVACEGRCRLSKRPNLCKRSCGSCCHRCKCVPPGTSGNYEACPCYANLTTTAYAEDLGILYCFLTNWDASESALWHNILSRVWLSAPSLPLEDLKSSTNSRVSNPCNFTTSRTRAT